MSTVILSIYARIWSETLFLALFVFGMLMLCRALDASETESARWGGLLSLLAAAVLFGLAWIARYVGVTLVVSGGLAILLWSRRPPAFVCGTLYCSAW